MSATLAAVILAALLRAGCALAPEPAAAHAGEPAGGDDGSPASSVAPEPESPETFVVLDGVTAVYLTPGRYRLAVHATLGRPPEHPGPDHRPFSGDEAGPGASSPGALPAGRALTMAVEERAAGGGWRVITSRDVAAAALVAQPGFYRRLIVDIDVVRSGHYRLVTRDAASGVTLSPWWRARRLAMAPPGGGDGDDEEPWRRVTGVGYPRRRGARARDRAAGGVHRRRVRRRRGRRVT